MIKLISNLYALGVIFFFGYGFIFSQSSLGAVALRAFLWPFMVAHELANP